MLILERAVIHYVKYNSRWQFLYKNIVIGGSTKYWRQNRMPHSGAQLSLFIKLSLCLLPLSHHEATWNRLGVSTSSAPAHVLNY